MPGRAGRIPDRPLDRAFLTRAACLVVILNACFLCALVLVQALDGSSMEESLRRSVRQGELTSALYPRVRAGFRFADLDTFDECLGLSTGLPLPGASALHRAVAVPVLNVVEGDPCKVLVRYLRDGTGWDFTPYYRYWHGYQLYLRPMLTVFSVGEIRQVNYVLTALCLVAFLVAGRTAFPMWIPLVLLALFVTTTDALAIPRVTPHLVGIWVALLTGAATALAIRTRSPGRFSVRWIAIVSGAVFNFVDLLVNPPITPTLMAFVVLAAVYWQERSDTWWRRARGPALGAIALWFGSYAVTWTFKWIVAVAVLGREAVVANVLAAARLRLSSQFQGVRIGFADSTLHNLSYVGRLEVSLLLLASVGLLGIALFRSGAARETLGDFAALASPAVVPIAWVELMRNHSVNHGFFVYRSLSLSLAIVATTALMVWVRARSTSRPSGFRQARGPAVPAGTPAA